MRESRSVVRRLTPLRGLALLAIALTAGGGVAMAAGGHHQPGSAHAAKAKRGASAPRLQTPGNGSVKDAMPAFGWSAVKGAAVYEFELSADRGFSSTLYTIDTINTYVTLDKTITDGTYYWRVRSVNANKVAGPWSRAFSLTKSWTQAPVLLGPANAATISHPSTPLVLHWSSVPHAFKYLVYIATDPGVGSLVPGLKKPIETTGTSFALPGTLAADQTYYWAVQPEDAEGRTGARSSVSTFTWTWPTKTTLTVADATGFTGTDLAGLPKVLSPRFSWTRVPGAAEYELEVNPAADFAPGSRVCCSGLTNATSWSPQKFLPNNVYHWRVRAFDLDGNAGRWNYSQDDGQDFRKAFDDNTPTIPDLQVADANNGLITWSPVQGASEYEVDIAGYNTTVPNDCDWSNPPQYFTSTNAWSPLAGSSPTPGPASWPGTSSDGIKSLSPGRKYCVRVLALTDKDLNGNNVVSTYRQIGGFGSPAFTYQPDFGPAGPLAHAQDSDYLTMTTLSATTHMPVFKWKPIVGAQSYFVVVAKDSSFTNVVDVALTNAPLYAPRKGGSPRTYSDENTHYYWEILPAANANGSGCTCDWASGVEHPQAFDKQSIPPTLLSPTGGTGVTEQPTFSWTPAEGARTYRLQVSQDPTFSDPIDDVTTDSTSYTSTTTYPADTVLYWRVRASDWNGIGLNWSAAGTFRRVLPAPTLDASNPTLGADIPVIGWSQVPGATSYHIHIEQGDGSVKEFDTRSTTLTFVGFWGVGDLRWQVRADFPKAGFGETAGSYSSLQGFTRQIPPPTGVRWTYGRRHVLLSWDPSTNIGTQKYKVQISTTNSFSSTIDSHTTENTSYAPSLKQKDYTKGVTLYWRVATVDERGTVGAWVSRTLTLAGRMHVKVRGKLHRHRRSVVTVKLTNARGRVISGARVTVAGVPVHKVTKRTSRSGTVRFRLRPTRKGNVSFTGAKSGYQSGRASLRVR